MPHAFLDIMQSTDSTIRVSANAKHTRHHGYQSWLEILVWISEFFAIIAVCVDGSLPRKRLGFEIRAVGLNPQ